MRTEMLKELLSEVDTDDCKKVVVESGPYKLEILDVRITREAGVARIIVQPIDEGCCE